MSAKKLPTFIAKSQLARYVHDIHLKRGNRVSSAAFLPNPGDSYLSVNSVELETLSDIACNYRERFQDCQGAVAVASRKVYEYNNAATHVGIAISYNKIDGVWEYSSHKGTKEAYRHRPVPPPIRLYSHCGVEYINTTLGDLILDKIARRLAGKRPQLFLVTE